MFMQERLRMHHADQREQEECKTAYIRIKAEEDARLSSLYKNSSWRQILIGMNLFKSHDEDRAQAKRRIIRLLHPDGFRVRHKCMEDKARAEAQFVFLNGVI